MCLSLLFLLDLIILIIFAEKCELISPSSGNFIFIITSPSLYVPNILLSTLFLSTLNI
jgi:hypothetical protein